MTVENSLPHGLKTSVPGSAYKTEYDANLALLDKNRLLVGLFSARPAFGAAERFYFATDTGALYYDDGANWLDVSAMASHSHPESDIVNLVADLAGKAQVSHVHTEADITSLVTDLAAKENAANKGVANGYASLGPSAKIPVSQIPDTVVGQMEYIGTWNSSTNTPAIPAASTANKGNYYKVSIAGATNIDGITDWKVGDWIISNGTAWDKIDNTESVFSVAGKTGAVTLAKADVGLTNVDDTTDAGKPVSTAQQSALDLKSDKTAVPSMVSFSKTGVGIGAVVDIFKVGSYGAGAQGILAVHSTSSGIVTVANISISILGQGLIGGHAVLSAENYSAGAPPFTVLETMASPASGYNKIGLRNDSGAVCTFNCTLTLFRGSVTLL